VPWATVIEKDFDVPFIADLALREKQIQQNYRPIISVHKWFARRPGTLFRGLLLSEFVDAPLREAFYRAHRLYGVRIADPFMGGGTPLLEANRLGCEVLGFDINPMSWWIVREQLDHIDLKAYRAAAARLRAALEKEIGPLYTTRCVVDGADAVPVKYFLWVKILHCDGCGKDVDLFPGYLLAEDRRHPRNVLVCHACGELNEVKSVDNPGRCRCCRVELRVDGLVSRGRLTCPHCGKEHRIPSGNGGPLSHRMFAIEYTNPKCVRPHEGRFFKKPDAEDLAKVAEAEKRLAALRVKFVPDDAIPKGDETDRLHRWGYRHYREMFNARQLLGLELSARLVSAQKDERLLHALATNLSDLLRYQNLLCRYDTMALKSLDIFSVHGFPVGLIQAESNLLGIRNPITGASIGSGGWANVIEKYAKAKAYCEAPFEIRHCGADKVTVPITGEWIGEKRNGVASPETRAVTIECGDSAVRDLPRRSLDGVFTDPPYFGNVQYAELMDFCYVWLRRLLGERFKEFKSPSTRQQQELTGNVTLGRNIEHFTDGMSAVFQHMAEALKPGAPLAFTFHHNDLDAYVPIAVAILDSGLACSATLPCPAEMGGSIHIHGTLSSIIDTVFVCRSTGITSRQWLTNDAEGLAAVVQEQLDQLQLAGVKPTRGDARCLIAGHLSRLAIWHNREGWRHGLPTVERIGTIRKWFERQGGIEAVLPHLEKAALLAVRVAEPPQGNISPHDEVSF